MALRRIGGESAPAGRRRRCRRGPAGRCRRAAVCGVVRLDFYCGGRRCEPNRAFRAGRLFFAPMCRSIRTLHNFEPPATDEEVHAAALQYVRKISGSSRPSRANQEAFDRAVAEISAGTRRLVDSLVTAAAPKNRAEEAAKARARAARRRA